MGTRDQIIDKVLEAEGGYVHDPSDSGGETNFGITVKVARRYGYTGEMLHLPLQVARDIYAARYWVPVCGDQLPQSVAAEVFDTAVNCGVSRASKFLQRALNALNNGGKIAEDIETDGHIGVATLDALEDYLAVKGEANLLKALNCLQGAFYIDLAETRRKDERFLNGWLANRVNL